MELKIYIDRLREGQVEIFEGSVDSEFLGQDPGFDKEISIQGKAYLAGDHLILKLRARAQAFLPCSVCNEKTQVPLELHDFYHAKPTSELPAVYDFSSLLREDLLLLLPQFAECRGSCPERTIVEKFLRESKQSQDPSNHFPFADL